MKPTTRVIAFLFVAGLTGGKAAAEPKQSEAAAAPRAKVDTKAKAAAQARDDAYAQRAEFVERMEKELVGIQHELDKLAAKVERVGGAAKAEAKTRLETVREKWAQAKKQLDQAKSATESTWDDVKGGFKKAEVELKGSVEKTRQWLSDKIAP